MLLLAPTGALLVMMVYYIYPQQQLFQIFTQSIDAIDVTRVTLRDASTKKLVFFRKTPKF